MPIAIGDIHGCLTPLRLLIDRLPPDETLIFLGDYIDRGPDSVGVLHYLQRLTRERPCRFLVGNHEDLMLKAIEAGRHIGTWLMNGGTATIRSYGLEPGEWMHSPERGAFLEQDRAFVVGLELYVEDEATIFVHAGIDPNIPEMALQERETLLWIRERFFRAASAWEGKEIVFGHTPTLLMGLPHGEIFQKGKLYGIDTGCVYGGVLTALHSRTHEIFQEPSDFSYR